jgi:DNA polymerase-3 subunit delta'
MAWPNLVGHEVVWTRLQRCVSQGRLASTFLFVGPAGIGKRTVATRLAQALLCQNSTANELRACQTCAACQQVEARTHPDFINVAKPADRSYIPIELFIGDREHRMRAGLCHDISLKPYSGSRKVAIIDDADYLNQEGANCLLKTLEEPPGRSVIILIGTSPQRQLPTIRSRCQIVRFPPLTPEQTVQLLKELDWISDEHQARELATRAEGSLQRAKELLDDDLEQCVGTLLMQFSGPPQDSLELTKQISQFIDSAGKDAPARRARSRALLLTLVSLYRHTMRELAGVRLPRDRATEQFVGQAVQTFRAGPALLLPCLERCLEAIQQVDANANLATLTACWVDDLSQATIAAASEPQDR